MYRGSIDNDPMYEVWVDSRIVFTHVPVSYLKLFTITKLEVSSDIRDWLYTCFFNIKLVLVVIAESTSKYEKHAVTKDYFSEVREFNTANDLNSAMRKEERVVNFVTDNMLNWVARSMMLDVECNYSGFSTKDIRRGRNGRRKTYNLHRTKRRERRRTTGIRRRFKR